MDVFDSHYLHLFLWNHRRRELAGAYRLGLTDQILQAMGPEGLYSHQLFRYKSSFLTHLGQSIELGRSFIRPEYQKQFSCLSLLWRGIGEFIARCPSYRLLFGPVSISQAYAEVSRRLLVQFLTARKFAPDLADMVRPRCPYRAGAIAGLPKSDLHAAFQDIDDVSLLISTLEEDAKGVPVLLRQYLKLNGRLISFNVDKAFSRVVDGLFLVDLRHTDPRLLTRFMGPEGAARFTGFHRLTLHRRDQTAACAPPAGRGLPPEPPLRRGESQPERSPEPDVTKLSGEDVLHHRQPLHQGIPPENHSHSPPGPTQFGPIEGRQFKTFQTFGRRPAAGIRLRPPGRLFFRFSPGFRGATSNTQRSAFRASRGIAPWFGAAPCARPDPG